MKNFIFTILIAIFIFVLPSEARSQSLEDDENFTGTYAEDEDPDHPLYEEKQEEKTVFGDSEDSEEIEEEIEEDLKEKGEVAEAEEEPKRDDLNYFLKFAFETSVTFHDVETLQVYMEVTYNTTIETEITILEKRVRIPAKAEIKTEIVGHYADSELYLCQLEIEIDPADVEIMTRLRNMPSLENEEELITNLALQIKFKKSIQENWYANCNSYDGFNLKTKGDTEQIGIIALEEATPGLNALLIEGFDFNSGAEIDLETPVIDFEEINMDPMVIVGKGTITLEPL